MGCTCMLQNMSIYNVLIICQFLSDYTIRFQVEIDNETCVMKNIVQIYNVQKLQVSDICFFVSIF